MSNPKTYVITGSASGIGKALTERLSDNNIVFAGYRNHNHKNMLEEISGNVYPFYIDYTKPETIELASNYIVSKCTKIDTVINVAGCVVAGPIEKISLDDIRRQFEVNVFGHIGLTQKLMPVLENGKIINVSSMASYGFFPFISPYCASKRALDIFFNAFAIENKKNIKVISIKPGVISTPLWSKSVDENAKNITLFEDYKEEMESIAENAMKNEKDGLSVDKVVEVIIKADTSKNPKPSYTVGKDALGARIMSLLPQEILNSIIKFGLKQRASKRSSAENI